MLKISRMPFITTIEIHCGGICALSSIIRRERVVDIPFFVLGLKHSPGRSNFLAHVYTNDSLFGLLDKIISETNF